MGLLELSSNLQNGDPNDNLGFIIYKTLPME